MTKRGTAMRWWLAALAAGTMLAGAPAVAAPDAAPTTVDGVLTGPHHLTSPAFSLLATDWWLTAPAGDGGLRLIVEVHMPQYPLLDHATDGEARPLALTVLARGPSTRFKGRVSERVAVTLPRDTAEQARTRGLTVTVAGKARSLPISVPGASLAAFLDAARAAPAAPEAPPPAPGAPTVPPAPLPPAPAPAAAPAPTPAAPLPTPPAAASSAPQPAPAHPPLDDDPLAPDARRATPPPAPAPVATDAPAQGGSGTWIDRLGIQIIPTPQGAMVLAVKSGSIAATKGIQTGDFIEAVDGKPIGDLAPPAMVARIGAPGVRTLHMTAAGDIPLR